MNDSQQDATPPTGPLDEFEILLLECLKRLEQEGESAVDELIDSHPAHASALRSRLGTLKRWGFLNASQETPGRLGDFDILERLGEGGMGVVFRARQRSLGREVALKLIRPEQLHFSGARRRFQREVEMIARLQHPGIVAVHAVGEENGTPFFAMELIHGKSVDELLERNKGRAPAALRGSDLDPQGKGESYLFAGSWEEACLRIVHQVCVALEFAHGQGILHRDLKPSNMMISSDGTARALLLDFGLSRSEESDKLTRTGAQLGSLRYMAPEQVSGEAAQIGPATDVYGLGVSLYEMLSMAPAFDGSQTQVALKITKDGLPLLRTRNPIATWEAETICATATDPDPRRRYASAADMARDLMNALQKRPIEARRAGAWLRTRRWIERNPAKAVAGVLGTLLLVGGPSTFAWQQVHASHAISEQRDRAVGAFEKTMLAIEQMLARVGAEDLAYVPAMEGLRRKLLEDAVRLMEEVVAEGGDDISEGARMQLAKTYKRLGQLLGSLGRYGESAPAFADGRRLLEAQLETPAETPGLHALLVSVAIEEAGALAQAGELEPAVERHEALAEWLAPYLDRPRYALYQAENQGALAWTYSRLGDEARAVSTFRAACEALDAFAEEPDAPWSVVLSAATAWNNYGQHYLRPTATEVPEVAVEILERATELARRVVEAAPEPQHQHRLCATLINLAGAFRRQGRAAESLEATRDARERLEALVADYPDTLSFRLELATVLNQIGLVHDTSGRLAEAEPLYRAAAEHLEHLVDAAPDEPLYHHRLAVALYNVSYCENKRDELVSAEESVARGIESARRAIEFAPHQQAYQVTLMDLLTVQRMTYEKAGDHEGVADSTELMLESVPELGEAYHRGAYAFALAARLARTDEWIEPEAREAAAERYVERACELTREAVERGATYADLRDLRNLIPLHGTPQFESLLEWFDGYRREHPLAPAAPVPPASAGPGQ